ncbi:hypothetical protein [Rhodococcus wratislaviensis]|uniref:hypothetical protein n=1 Tax=Rhodococcus wratislaviensis TaxID=44752 RepID=UPI000F574A2B|nr:hypothetical protein [Rhodococcus wratislaviensis]
MTLLMYRLAKNSITVVTDTLAASDIGDDTHQRKFWIPHHGKFIVAGMGSGNLIAPWIADVAESGFSSADEVARFTADTLPARWHNIQDAFGSERAKYATAYMFGFRNGKATRISCSARDGFHPKREGRHGLAARPLVPNHVINTSGALEPGSDDDEDLMAVATAVAHYDRTQPDAVPIGGEVIAARITSRGAHSITTLGILV